MKRMDNQFITPLNFKEQIPDMWIGYLPDLLLYEKSFLTRAEVCESEFTLDTTTWD